MALSFIVLLGDHPRSFEQIYWRSDQHISGLSAHWCRGFRARMPVFSARGVVGSNSAQEKKKVRMQGHDADVTVN